MLKVFIGLVLYFSAGLISLVLDAFLAAIITPKSFVEDFKEYLLDIDESQLFSWMFGWPVFLVISIFLAIYVATKNIFHKGAN